MLRDLFSLFPAYAGVIPDTHTKTKTMQTFPRIRGGDPVFYGASTSKPAFSPHTRG